MGLTMLSSSQKHIAPCKYQWETPWKQEQTCYLDGGLPFQKYGPLGLMPFPKGRGNKQNMTLLSQFP